MENEEKKSDYGKRPLWQWIALYVIIGVLIYGAIYYFVLAKNNGANVYNQSQAPTTQQ